MSKVISADVSEDLAERIEEEQEEGESRSATVRRLVRSGLDPQPSGIGNLPNRRIMIVAGVLLLLIGATPPEPLRLAFGIAGMSLNLLGGLLELVALTSDRP
jgi:hypothetical protein